MIWYVVVMGVKGAAPAQKFGTKREALGFIQTLGDISRISRSTVPGGRSYTVTPKGK